MQTHSFSIENAINSLTGQPFGPEYAGQFTIRQPSLADKQMIAVKKAAIMSAFGYIADETMIRPGIRLSIHIYAHVTHTAVEKVPDWFNPEKMFKDTDEDAMLAVSQEVNRWLDTFRSKTNPPPSGGTGAKS
jgi:hypothetical protein